jgi:hypothetical protein
VDLHAWIADEGPENVRAPLSLNVETDAWPDSTFDAVFCANTVHIMGWPEVEKMFAGIGQVLMDGFVSMGHLMWTASSPRKAIRALSSG